eukprot:TRINITY_DN1443_c0_g1_i1.p2 TRINITY_DN1443_c0_g1~~TRINITY_DN1443_c0_g1_i1.p2  ORF type:complete len:240 (-),score=8.82 TRINITY_DN1443_c0_g1_i1:72-791(-)
MNSNQYQIKYGKYSCLWKATSAQRDLPELLPLLVRKQSHTSQRSTIFIRKRNQKWEVITRNFPHKTFGCKIVPVAVSAKVPPRIITLLSYRIPLKNYVVEFPAGANDSGDIEECCLRELKVFMNFLIKAQEETGYVGKIEKEHGFPPIVAHTDPWKSDDNSAILLAKIDLDSKENFKPLQNLDPTENIKIMLLSLDNFYEDLKKLVEQEKHLIDETVWAFALGMKFQKLVNKGINLIQI